MFFSISYNLKHFTFILLAILIIITSSTFITYYVLDDNDLTGFSRKSHDIIRYFVDKRPKNLMLVCIVQYYLQIPVQIRNGFTYLILGKQNDRKLGLEKETENRVTELKNKLRNYEFVMINLSLDNLKINEL